MFYRHVVRAGVGGVVRAGAQAAAGFCGRERQRLVQFDVHVHVHVQLQVQRLRGVFACIPCIFTTFSLTFISRTLCN